LTIQRNTAIKNSGFTIIEVMIVLAAAGLIMLLVFLAVPQLERVGSNSQRSSDASSVLQLVSEYMLSNSGTPPTPCGPIVGSNSVCSSENDLGALKKLTTVYLSTSSANDISIYPTSAASATNITSSVFPTIADKDTWLIVYNYEICQTAGSNPIATTNGAGYNDIVAVYEVQSGSGYEMECQQLR
jgi:prepilin-type N-terminal cleavage/methylation domain-containing protein